MQAAAPVGVGTVFWQPGFVALRHAASVFLGLAGGLHLCVYVFASTCLRRLVQLERLLEKCPAVSFSQSTGVVWRRFEKERALVIDTGAGTGAVAGAGVSSSADSMAHHMSTRRQPLRDVLHKT